MDFITNFPLFSIVLSLFSGALCFTLRGHGRAAKIYTVCVESVLIALNLCVLIYTLKTGTSFTYTMGEFPAPWGNEIRAGVLEAFLAVSFVGILLCSVLAGYRFVRIDMDAEKINLYYALINLLTAALMALIWTNDIFTGYVFLEIMTLTSCGILIVREIGRTTLAAVRYMIMNLLGSGLFLLGVVLLYDLTGHLLMVPMQEAIRELSVDTKVIPVLTMSVVILTIGLSIKSGLFPFHFWMPDTYGWATPTSASILSSLVSKAYIFLLIKIYYRAVGFWVIEQMPIQGVLMVLGICGIVIGSFQAIRANTINSMVAFSSAAQIGYIYMGIGLGGEAGYTAAIFHMLAHAVTKSLLFLTTPRLAAVSGESLIFKRLQGSGLRDRMAGVAFLISSFSMIGIPIFAGFSSKIQFGLAAVSTRSDGIVISVMLALALSSALNAVYFIRTIIRIYSTRDGAETEEDTGRSRDLSFVGPMLALTLGNLFLGLFSWIAVGWIQTGLSMFS
ncbi:MAG: sodium:proton antiporter [Clostridiales bacterium]|nr:sodium:proton antiporter [Clostridiales bacterium]